MVVGVSKKKKCWYAAGLSFECQQCGRCCSGPGSGYIWVTAQEIKLIAGHLGLTEQQLWSRYLQRVRLRTTIIEDAKTNDCIFLGKDGERRFCEIYPVRPNQCRTWPFWPQNLTGPNAWNRAAKRCPGMNRGRLYSFEEIEQRKKQKRWWQDGPR